MLAVFPGGVAVGTLLLVPCGNYLLRFTVVMDYPVVIVGGGYGCCAFTAGYITQDVTWVTGTPRSIWYTWNTIAVTHTPLPSPLPLRMPVRSRAPIVSPLHSLLLYSATDYVVLTRFFITPPLDYYVPDDWLTFTVDTGARGDVPLRLSRHYRN